MEDTQKGVKGLHPDLLLFVDHCFGPQEGGLLYSDQE